MAKKRVHRCTEDYRAWIKNGTARQKKLWELESKLHNKVERRTEYMAIVNELQTFLPPSEGNGGKYGQPIHVRTDDESAKGLKCFLRRNF